MYHNDKQQLNLPVFGGLLISNEVLDLFPPVRLLCESGCRPRHAFTGRVSDSTSTRTHDSIAKWLSWRSLSTCNSFCRVQDLSVFAKVSFGCDDLNSESVSLEPRDCFLIYLACAYINLAKCIVASDCANSFLGHSRPCEIEKFQVWAVLQRGHTIIGNSRVPQRNMLQRGVRIFQKENPFVAHWNLINDYPFQFSETQESLRVAYVLVQKRQICQQGQSRKRLHDIVRQTVVFQLNRSKIL
jgi:hypothetical protein